MLNESGVFVIDGVDVYNYYDSDYYGMSAYIFCYKNQDENFLFTLPGCYFEEILKILSQLVSDNCCLLLEKFIDGGLDFDFNFQNNELGEWWTIPDKDLFLENLKVIDDSKIESYFNDDNKYYINFIGEIHKNLVNYLDNNHQFFLHYM